VALDQPFFVLGYFEIGSLTLFAQLASNLNPPDLCLLPNSIISISHQRPAVFDFWDMVWLHSCLRAHWPQTPAPPVSAFPVLGFQVCTSRPSQLPSPQPGCSKSVNHEYTVIFTQLRSKVTTTQQVSGLGTFPSPIETNTSSRLWPQLGLAYSWKEYESNQAVCCHEDLRFCLFVFLCLTWIS
jgi:hypothetical protein